MCPNKSTFRLKEQIEALKGGVTAAANHLGKSRNTIYNWMEKGNAPLDQLEKLSEIGVDIHYITTGFTLQELNKNPDVAIFPEGTPEGINETSKLYRNTSAPPNAQLADTGNFFKPDNLDNKLAAIINNYINDGTLTLITTALDQTLDKRNLTLNEDKKIRLTAAAQNAYERLTVTGRVEKFDELLNTLIDAALVE